jgi:phosphinothricin acetyltransferase
MIRIATPQDATAIQRIYAPFVAEGAVSFETEVPTPEEIEARIKSTLYAHPWLVKEEDGKVVAYAYASAHRTRAAYQWCAEVSVYVDPAFHNRGIARRLYQSLIDLLSLQGFVNLYAGITLPNEASVGFHEAMGFRKIGVYEKIGFKAGNWHDVGWWTKTLSAPIDHPSAPLLFKHLTPDLIEEVLKETEKTNSV